MHVFGHFETHLTLRHFDTGPLNSLHDAARELGLKLTLIVLQSGHQPTQPMLTRHSQGSLESVLHEAHDLSRQLLRRDLHVDRIKLEVGAEHPASPKNQDEADLKPKDWHFEHHVKLLLPARTDLSPLQQLVEKHTARLSRNALRVRNDGQEERFVTQRFYSAGRDAAGAALSRLTSALSQVPLTILESEAEYVVHDSNATLDAGWLEACEHP